MIRWWIDLWDRREAPTVMAIVRIGLATVILSELLTIAAYDLVDVVFVTADHGGLATPRWSQEPWWIALFGGTPASAFALHALCIVASVCLLIGLATPVSALALLLLYAQTALILPHGDRAIDMLLRNAMMILVFARSGAIWSVDAWWRTGRLAGSGEDVPAWPRYLLVLQLVVMYFTAGVQKYAVHWWPWGGYSALYVILNDWTYARFPFHWLKSQPLYLFTQVSTAVTMFFQVTYPVVLLHYFPLPGDRLGGLRRAMARYHLHWVWIGVGAFFHFGIAVTMNLGIFPWGMLVLYPAYLHPRELRAIASRVRHGWRRAGSHADAETRPGHLPSPPLGG